MAASSAASNLLRLGGSKRSFKVRYNLPPSERPKQELAVQQLTVSHAAHDARIWTFHGTRGDATIDARLAALLQPLVSTLPLPRE